MPTTTNAKYHFDMIRQCEEAREMENSGKVTTKQTRKKHHCHFNREQRNSSKNKRRDKTAKNANIK